jgi:Holin of 3TMs, for gene-transfer release
MLAILGIIAPILEKVLTSVIPDPQARQKAILEIYSSLQQSDLAQIDVNKAEAASNSLFTSGWRPFIGWVCGGALFYQYMFIPLGGFVASFFGDKYVTVILNAPKLDGTLWELMFGMLGMGALRSFDKIRGVAK